MHSVAGFFLVCVVFLVVLDSRIMVESEFVSYDQFSSPPQITDKYKEGHILAVRTCANGYVHIKNGCRKIFGGRRRLERLICLCVCVICDVFFIFGLYQTNATLLFWFLLSRLLIRHP